MGKYKAFAVVIVSLLISFALVIVLGLNNQKTNPNEVYKVYIDGKFIGAIKSKRALEEYINNEQSNLKKEYDVDKVYIPNGIDVEKAITYKGKILRCKRFKNISKHVQYDVNLTILSISSCNK